MLAAQERQAVHPTFRREVLEGLAAQVHQERSAGAEEEEEALAA